MTKQRIPKPRPPCYRCKDRKIGCHASCKRYQAYFEQNEKYKAQNKISLWI